MRRNRRLDSGTIVRGSRTLTRVVIGGIICVLTEFAFGQITAVSAIPPGALRSAPPADVLAAANAGDRQSQLAVGKAYNGDGIVRRDYPEAVKWFTAAAALGSVEASAWLGSCYVYGHGVPQDMSQGTSLIEAAAGQNNPVGLRLLGIMYEEGEKEMELRRVIRRRRGGLRRRPRRMIRTLSTG
jgi:Sel1 repeat